MKIYTRLNISSMNWKNYYLHVDEIPRNVEQAFDAAVAAIGNFYN